MPEPIKTKRCRACKDIKPTLEFYKHSKMKDGLINQCKNCHEATRIRYRLTKQGKAANLKSVRNTKSRYPNRIKARSAVSNRFATGRLPKPDSLQCHYCPKQAEQYHHHKGYAREHWLDVIPLCLDCHSTIHDN